MKFTVYGKDSCPACKKAVDLLETYGKEFDYIDVSQDKEALRYIKEELQAKTVPQIFEGDHYIGGLDHLRVMIS